MYGYTYTSVPVDYAHVCMYGSMQDVKDVEHSSNIDTLSCDRVFCQKVQHNYNGCMVVKLSVCISHCTE